MSADTSGRVCSPLGVPVERLRAMIRLLWPDEITPIAKRQLESLCDATDQYLIDGED